MLAAIGVIIMVKQIPVALGAQGKGEPLEMIREIPNYVRNMNPEIALIGIVGLAIMFLWPWVQKRFRQLRVIPSALMVLAVTVPMGIYFDLLHTHTYSFHGHQFEIGESYLVNMPDRVLGMFEYVTRPDFSALLDPARAVNAWKWVLMFFIIGTLESMLSAKAVDLLDPWRRKTNLDRDIMAVGAGNLCSAMVGGLPMISEIVRSKANIDNGARTRFADMWHGIFLLICVALIPTVLHRIPLAALAAMLIYTGFRLTHPKEFLHVYAIGKEQLVIFVSTLVGVLVTADLLLGIMLGIGVKLAIHVFNGVPVWSLFKPYLDIRLVGDDCVYIRAKYSAVFSNWIQFRRKLVQYGLMEHRNVTVDLSQAKFVDHSVMEKLHNLQSDFEDAGLKLELRGLDQLQQLSQHELAARKRGLTRLRRVTVVADEALGQQLADKFVELGASGFTAIPCSGAGRRQLAGGGGAVNSQLRVEAVVPQDVAERILDYLRSEVADEHVTTCVESVEVLQRDQF